jgi:small-conductance mechanosensitive channel
VRLSHGQDVAQIREALPAVAGAVDGVLATPAPTVLTADLAADTLELRLLFWVDPRASDLDRVRSEVLETVERVLGEHGVRADDEAPAKGKTLDLDT